MIDFPKILREGSAYNLDFLVMPMYGKSLNHLLSLRRDKRFSLKTICIIGIKMVLYNYLYNLIDRHLLASSFSRYHT